MGAVRSRARAAVCCAGGAVVGCCKSRPVIYAVPPDGGITWPYWEVSFELNGVRDMKRVSRIDGCTVIWS